MVAVLDRPVAGGEVAVPEERQSFPAAVGGSRSSAPATSPGSSPSGAGRRRWRSCRMVRCRSRATSLPDCRACRSARRSVLAAGLHDGRVEPVGTHRFLLDLLEIKQVVDRIFGPTVSQGEDLGRLAPESRPVQQVLRLPVIEGTRIDLLQRGRDMGLLRCGNPFYARIVHAIPIMR